LPKGRGNDSDLLENLQFESAATAHDLQDYTLGPRIGLGQSAHRSCQKERKIEIRADLSKDCGSLGYDWRSQEPCCGASESDSTVTCRNRSNTRCAAPRYLRSV